MYTVGDVIWVASTSYPSVKPYQIVEEITHKNLKGTVKSFNVKAATETSKFVSLDDLEGDIFTDIDSLRIELNKRASEAIESMLESGNGLIKKYFESSSEDVIFEGEDQKDSRINNSNDQADQQASEENEDFVTLPDGTRARLKIKGDIL